MSFLKLTNSSTSSPKNLKSSISNEKLHVFILYSKAFIHIMVMKLRQKNPLSVPHNGPWNKPSVTSQRSYDNTHNVMPILLSMLFNELKWMLSRLWSQPWPSPKKTWKPRGSYEIEGGYLLLPKHKGSCHEIAVLEWDWIKDLPQANAPNTPDLQYIGCSGCLKVCHWACLQLPNGQNCCGLQCTQKCCSNAQKCCNVKVCLWHELEMILTWY